MKFSWKPVLIFILSFVFLTQAQVFQSVPNAGTVNWQTQLLKATGIGAPNPKVPFAAQRAGAIRAAKLAALRDLLETVKGMRLTSETLVENAMLSNDVIVTRVEGILKSFKTVDTRYLSDGSVEVDVEIPLSGILLDAILPQQMGGQQPGNVQYATQAAQQFVNTAYSGLIIDARGLGLNPAMAPKILDENGNEVYGTGFVSREYAVQIGVVGYEKNLERAKSNERVADNAIVVKAKTVSGTNQSDVVIDNNSAANIQAAAKNLNFMEQCKVMIIVD